MESRAQEGGRGREVHPCSVTSSSFEVILYLQYKSNRTPPLRHERTGKGATVHST